MVNTYEALVGRRTAYVSFPQGAFPVKSTMGIVRDCPREPGMTCLTPLDDKGRTISNIRFVKPTKELEVNVFTEIKPKLSLVRR